MEETEAGWHLQRVSSYMRGQAFPGRRGVRPPEAKDQPERLAVMSLPEPGRDGGAGLWGVMAARRSERSYHPGSITLAELSQLLWAAQGLTGREKGDLRLRTVPSAGGLHPFDLYVVVNRVEGMEPGLYHYLVANQSLEFLRSGMLGADLARAALDQQMMERAAVNIALAAVVARCVWRYHERAWRYMYLDAGHIMQNLALAATAMGLGLCPIGAFYDREVDEFFGLDQGEGDAGGETVMYMGSIGRLR